MADTAGSKSLSRGKWQPLNVRFDDALARIPAALQQEGFGVLTQIDVKATLSAKLGVEFRNYRILGACNPKYAHRALTEDLCVGMLLPCNVVLYETDEGQSVLGIVDPIEQLGAGADPAMLPLASEVAEKLGRVMEAARAWA